MNIFEEWRPLFPGYEVSDCGRVRSRRRGTLRIMVPQPVRNGYLIVGLYVDGRRQFFQVHRLVARVFLGDPKGRHVDHLNNDRTDNRAPNLEYVTQAENNLRAYRRDGRKPRGACSVRAARLSASVTPCSSSTNVVPTERHSLIRPREYPPVLHVSEWQCASSK